MLPISQSNRSSGEHITARSLKWRPRRWQNYLALHASDTTSCKRLGRSSQAAPHATRPRLLVRYSLSRHLVSATRPLRSPVAVHPSDSVASLKRSLPFALAGSDAVAEDKHRFRDSQVTISVPGGALKKRLGRSDRKTQRLRRSLKQYLDIVFAHSLSQTGTTAREVVSIYGFDTIADLQYSQSSLDGDTVARKRQSL